MYSSQLAFRYLHESRNVATINLDLKQINSISEGIFVHIKSHLVAQIPYKLEIIKSAVDSDSVGSLVCKRAEQLNAVAVVLAKHNKGSIQEFFVGSVTNYCE
jgi:nucleotide-binding universal stress UspA family protein